MADWGSILEGVGGAGVEYGAAVNARRQAQADAAQKAIEQEYAGQDRQLSLMERAERIKTLREQREAAYIKAHPEFAEAGEQKRRQGIVNQLKAIDPNMPKGVEQYILINGQIPEWYWKPEKPTPEKKPTKVEEFEYLTKVEHIPAHKAFQMVGWEETAKPSEDDKEEKKFRKKVSDLKTILGRELSPSEVASIRLGQPMIQDVTDLKEKAKIREKAAAAKPKIADQISQLTAAKKTIAQAKAMNRQFAALIKPLIGWLEENDIWRSKDVQKVLTAFQRLLGVAVKESNAGSRGYTKYEQQYFSKLIPALHNTPDQNEGILEDWEAALQTDTERVLSMAADLGLEADEFSHSLGEAPAREGLTGDVIRSEMEQKAGGPAKATPIDLSGRVK